MIFDKKTCVDCYYFSEYDGVCCNGESEHRADFWSHGCSKKTVGCELFEEFALSNSEYVNKSLCIIKDDKNIIIEALDTDKNGISNVIKFNIDNINLDHIISLLSEFRDEMNKL